MLALIARDHVDRLLDQVEIEVLVGKRRGEVEVPVDEGLRARVEQSIDVRLVPPRLFDWLKLAVEVVEPLSYVSLVRFERVIPRGIIKRQSTPLIWSTSSY